MSGGATTLGALFPICSIATCPDRGQHHHILPHQQQLLDSRAKYICMLGGYGSGKTVPALAVCLAYSLAIPNNRWVIVRRSNPKLHDSTLAKWVDMLHAAEIEYTGLENRDRFSHRYIFANGSEVAARESQNLGRWLGQDLGGWYVDEAQEEPEATFKGLVGRLRLPAAAGYLKGILTSNPPTERHWIAKIFGTEAGFRHQGETSFELIMTQTKQNTHLPPGYLHDLMATHSAHEVKRIVDGEYGLVADGPPVFPQFRPSLHVGFPTWNPRVALIRGWDFGFRHPVVTWHQLWRCREDAPHWSILDELDGQEIETEAFARAVLTRTEQLAPNCPPTLIIEAGDAAGASVNERGPGPIPRLTQALGLTWRYTKMRSMDPSLDFIRGRLEKPPCACGLPLVQIHRRCRYLIEAWLGGYHCPATRPTDVPVKDGYYDDFADSARYAIWNYLRREVLGTDDAESLIPERPATERPWDWLDPPPTEAQMIAEIQSIKQRGRRR